VLEDQQAQQTPHRMGHQEVTAALPALPFLEAVAVVMALLVTVLVVALVAVAAVELLLPQVEVGLNVRGMLEVAEDPLVVLLHFNFLGQVAEQEAILVDMKHHIQPFRMVQIPWSQVWVAFTPLAAEVELDGPAHPVGMVTPLLEMSPMAESLILLQIPDLLELLGE
jgi:hypothetical protein